MRNLAANWPRIPEAVEHRFEAQQLVVTSLTGVSQHLVSGNLAPFGEGLGPLGIAESKAGVLRVARDRLLVVNGDPTLLTPGWHAEGYAVSDVSAQYHVYEISGAGTPTLLAEATTLDLNIPGPSAAVVFAGIPAVLYCRETADRLMLHIERGYAAHIISWLEARG